MASSPEDPSSPTFPRPPTTPLPVLDPSSRPSTAATAAAVSSAPAAVPVTLLPRLTGLLTEASLLPKPTSQAKQATLRAAAAQHATKTAASAGSRPVLAVAPTDDRMSASCTTNAPSSADHRRLGSCRQRLSCGSQCEYTCHASASVIARELPSPDLLLLLLLLLL